VPLGVLPVLLGVLPVSLGVLPLDPEVSEAVVKVESGEST
jgi:hypothetical protein